MKKKPIFSTLILLFYFSFINFSSNAQNIWTQKANFPGVAREQIIGFSIGTKGYVGLGRDANNNLKNDFWEYNPSSNTWTQKANFSGSGIYGATGFSIGTKGYIGVGSNGSGGSFTNEFWEYNPSSNTWTQKANYPGQGRWSCTGFSVGSKGYLGLGWQGGIFNDFWEYNPSSNTWTQKANYGGGNRASAVGFGINTKGYVGTGDGTGGLNNNDFWEYDPSANIWTQKANFGGAARRFAAGFNIGTKGYIGLGRDNSNNLFNDFWEYDPSANIWTQKANYSGTSREGVARFSIDYKGYLGLGWTGQQNVFANDFWEYTPSLLYTSPLGTNSYCSGSVVTVSYTSSGVNFISGNIFTAQLSNASGSFSSPVNIGTLSSTATSGNISATIPTNTVAGTAYRIRVISSNPGTTGSDNGSNIIINNTTISGYYTIHSDYHNPGLQYPLYNNNSPIWLPANKTCGVNVYVTGPGTPSGSWSRASNSYPFSWYSSGTFLTFTGTSGTSAYQERNGIFNLSAQTVCGVSNGTYKWPIIVQGWGFSVSASPNPATDNLLVAITNESQEVKSLSASEDIILALADIQTGQIIKQWKFKNNQKQFNLNIKGIKKGSYLLRVNIGKYGESKQIIISN